VGKRVLGGGGEPLPEAFRKRYNGAIPNPGIGAEMIAQQWGFDRAALDEFSLGSHEKAAAAQDSDAFDARSSLSGTKTVTQCARTDASVAIPRSRRWRS